MAIIRSGRSRVRRDSLTPFNRTRRPERSTALASAAFTLILVNTGPPETLLAPDAVTIPLLTAAPTIVPGALTLTPAAVALPVVTATPSVVLTRTATPDAVPVPILTAAPSVVLTKTLAPSPVAIPILTTTPILGISLVPSSVAIPLLAVAPTVDKTFIATPAPVAIPILTAAPTLVRTYTATPSPVAIPILPVTPNVARHLIPASLGIPLVVANPVIVHTLALTPSALEVLLALADVLVDFGEQAASPDADISVGNWTTHLGGSTNLYATIDEIIADTADYMQSELNPDNSIYRGSLQDVDSPAAGTRSIKWTIRKSAEGARMDAALRVYEGATLVQTFTRLDVPSEWTEYTETITNPISDYDDLQFEVDADQI